MKKELLLPAATRRLDKLFFCFFDFLLVSFQSFSQTAAGKVTDGNGVSGGTVAVKGTPTAIGIDVAGQNSITSTPDAVFTISPVGLRPRNFLAVALLLVWSCLLTAGVSTKRW